MDESLHHLQGQTELVTHAELLDLLQTFYRDTLQLVQARQANAGLISAYDANNAYQQVLGRQETHLQWLSDAITDMGGVPAESPPNSSEALPADGQREFAAVVERDLKSQRTFMDRWSARLPSLTNARHRKMLELILGEMGEHARVFGQALEGRTDLLGRHADGKVLRGSVLPTRPRN